MAYCNQLTNQVGGALSASELRSCPAIVSGDLVNSGEKTPGEIVSYEPRIVEIHDFAPWSADEIIAAHRLANDARAAPRPSIKPFTRRSLRRG
jgi:hypothetical protein